MAAPSFPLSQAPAYDAQAVTPSDSTVLTAGARALYVGTGGDVEVITLGGTTVTFTNVPDGTILPIAATKVKAATTASEILALY